MPVMTGQQVRDYIVDSGFKRTDKDRELYAALTDVVRGLALAFPWQETETDVTTTDTITTLGDYRLDIDPAFGLLISDVVLVNGNVGVPLEKITKDEFDRRYSKPNDPYYRGYPKDYCIFGNQILIGPQPDKTSYSYKMSYSSDSTTAEITSSTSSVPFSLRYRELLKHGVLAELYAGLGEDGEAAKHTSLFEDKKYRAIQREVKNAGASECVAYQDR